MPLNFNSGRDNLCRGPRAYTELTYVGLLDVCATRHEELALACAELCQVAAASGMELRALDGRHDVAAAAALPLAQGLAPRGMG